MGSCQVVGANKMSKAKLPNPKRIYGVFTCSKCGLDFEKSFTHDYYVTDHLKYGTKTVHFVLRDQPVCIECLMKIAI